MSADVVPHAVGNTGVMVVGVEGEITELTSDTITIGGHKLPRRITDTVKYLSAVWPEDGECDEEHCDGDCCDMCTFCEEDQDEVERLIDLLEQNHNSLHAGAFRTCLVSICREARR